MSHREMVPVLEIDSKGRVKDTMAVPLHELDSMVGELSAEYDFGLGELHVENPEELGRMVRARASFKIAAPKISAHVALGKYKPLKPASKPTKKAPALKAVREVKTKGKKPVVLARSKPEHAHSERDSKASLSSIYKELKAQRKIIDLLATKRSITAEHNKLMAQDNFRDSVHAALKKIDKQCAGDTKGNYFARWNKLKNLTGVAVHER